MDASRDVPRDSLIPCWSGRGTDRQTETFGCRLFGYWLKATRNGNAFAAIKMGALRRRQGPGKRVLGAVAPPAQDEGPWA